MKTGNNLTQNYAAACEDVRDVVMAFRRQGIRTIGAIYEVAKAFGVKESRVRRLFFCEPNARIFDAERQQIRAAAIRTHRDLAARHRALAAANDAIADAKEAGSNPQLQAGEFVYVSVEGKAGCA